MVKSRQELFLFSTHAEEDRIFKCFWPIENRAYQGMYVANEWYMKNKLKEKKLLQQKLCSDHSKHKELKWRELERILKLLYGFFFI